VDKWTEVDWFGVVRIRYLRWTAKTGRFFENKKRRDKSRR